MRCLRTGVLLLLGGMAGLALTACGGDDSPKDSPGAAGGASSQPADALTTLKAAKYFYFDASAFKAPGQGGGVFVTFHEAAPLAWQGLTFSSSASWSYTAANGTAVEQKVTASGAVAADGKTLATLNLTETYTVVTGTLGTRVTHLEFANIPNTSVTSDPNAGKTWLATSKLPAAKSLLTSGTYTFPSGGTQPVSWEGGAQGISIGFSEKPGTFPLAP